MPGRGEVQSHGVLAAVLGVLATILLFCVVGGAFYVTRILKDRDIAEEMQHEAERRVMAAPVVAPEPAPAPVPVLPTPVPVPPPVEPATRPVAETPVPPSLPDAEREGLLAAIKDLQRQLDLSMRARATPVPETAPAAPRPDPLADALGREVDRAVTSLAQAGPATADDLRAAFEIGPIVLPLLSRRFRDPESGVAAVRLAGALPGVRIAALVREVGLAARADDAFRDASAAAFLGLAKRGDAEGLFDSACRDDVAPAVGLALIAAAAELDHPRSIPAIACGLMRTADERKLAVSLLIERGAAGREVLVAALRNGRTSQDTCLLLLAALLPGARATEGPGLGRAILAMDGGVAAALASRIGPDAAPGIAAELLAVALTEDREALLAHLFGADPKAGRQAILAASFANPGVSEQLQGIARERGRKAPLTAEDLRTRTDVAEPLDVPDILDSLDLVPAKDRSGPAAAAAAFGHPEGVAVLRRLSANLDPAVRLGVVPALSDPRIGHGSDILVDLLADGDLEVASASAGVIDARDLAVDPARGITALARLTDPCSSFVLQAMARGWPKATITALVVDALDRGAVADVYGAATFVMELHAGDGPEYPARFLGHREPLVRVAAIQAIGRPDEGSRGTWESVLERVSDDQDPLVRVAAARGLGKIKDDLARARLVALSRDRSWLVREAALLGLSGQEKTHVIPVLRRAQNDPEPFVANAARVALVRLGAEDVAQALVPDLGDCALRGRTKTALEKLLGARDLDQADLAARVEHMAGVASRPR